MKTFQLFWGHWVQMQGHWVHTVWPRRVTGYKGHWVHAWILAGSQGTDFHWFRYFFHLFSTCLKMCQNSTFHHFSLFEAPKWPRFTRLFESVIDLAMVLIVRLWQAKNQGYVKFRNLTVFEQFAQFFARTSQTINLFALLAAPLERAENFPQFSFFKRLNMSIWRQDIDFQSY